MYGKSDSADDDGFWFLVVIDDSEAVTADSTAEMPQYSHNADYDDDGDDDDDVPELASFRLQVSTNHNCLS